MPRDFSEDTEPERPREIDEVEEKIETEDIKKEAEEVANDALKELEEQERVERIRDESVRELKEMDDEAERKEKAEEIAREAAKELQGFEEDLRQRMEDAREDLHEEYVNDMKSKLKDGSSKETSSDAEETADGRESKEKPASGESYIEGNDGMVYSMETGEGSGSSSELETEESSEKVKEETREIEEEKNAEQEESVKIRNEISKPESSETAEVEETSEELPEKSAESAKVDETSIEESKVDESKKDHEEQVSVKESQDVEKSTRTETKEEYREETDESAEPTPHPVQELVEVDEVVEHPTENPESEESHMEEVPESSLEHEPERMVSDQCEITEDEVLESEETEDELEFSIELSEELEQQIDELVDEFVEELIEEIETQEEEEETTEPRIIVDAMTGNEHIDTSLEYRPYFQETEEESEQEEQEQLEEKIDEMFAKLSEEEQERIKESVRSKLKTEKDLEEWIKRNPSVKASPDYKEKLAEAKKYLRGKRKGPVPKLIKELWKDEVKRVWTSIVGAVLRKKLRKKLGDKLLASQILQDWTQERLDTLLNQYNELKKNLRFKKRYRNAVSWIIVMTRMKDGLFGTEPDIEILKHLAKEFSISKGSLRKWLKGLQKPMLIVQIERRLGLRSSPGGYHESLVRTVPITNSIELDSTQSTSTEIIKKISEAVSTQETGVWFVESSHELVHEIIQHLRKLHRKLKVGVLGTRIYIRKEKEDPFSWMEILQSENIYLDRKWKRELIGRVLGRLKLRNLNDLSEVVRRLTNFGKNLPIPVGGINADLQSRPNYLRGCSLGFFLDTVGLKLKDILSNVQTLGQSWEGQWQIKNPKFPEGEDLKIIIARLFSIIASDGHISKDTYSLTYFENEKTRRLRVIEVLQLLGDVYSVETLNENQADSLRLPPLLGRIMAAFGIPVGDKVLQSFGVPSFILNGSVELQQAYLQELIPEEGAVTYTVDGGLKILWGRTVVLHEIRSSKKYAKQKTIKKELVDLIRDEGDYEEKRQCYRLSAGKLRGLKSHPDSRIATLAADLERIVRKNPSKLLIDEKKLCKKIGIKTGHHLCYVRYYTKSGRVSAHWEAHTRTQDDVKKWWQVAPPNDVIKRARLDDHFR